MPKIISTALVQHLAGEETMLATCWKMTRRNDVMPRFTYARTAIRSTADLVVNNLDVERVLGSSS